MKFSLYAYIMPKVSLSWWKRRCTGSCARYASVSCIQPMFHFIEKPRPPTYTSAATPSASRSIPRRGHRAPGKLPVHHGVQLAQEVDRLEVLRPP
jgi:hypothetical protein